MRRLSKYHSIEKMAKVLNVSRSGYYAFINRKESIREMRTKEQLEAIKKIHSDSNKTYGSPRIYRDMMKGDIKCGQNKVARLMRENDIRSIVKRKHKPYTSEKHNPDLVKDNILSRDFTVSEPNRKWVSDITYIRCLEGWLYLCVVIDLYSRTVVGWSMSPSPNTDLPLLALNMAVINRSPSKGLIFHSDRGCQYTSHKFQERLEQLKMTGSMSRKGNCWDNACCESFFHTLKTELIYHRKINTITTTKAMIFEYICAFYNTKRIHSSLNYLSPMEYELKYSA